ncbi:hypothetical protein BD410DRAFT_783774 [Rickenella mellea]|uniref:Uncharacterized protein n=1 Tax=Rickenella mellea TaxID=50990 RepID=A0A4Y7QG97_9AGAM|nr:hypothetical protein BD410DRAFT_783774 [Rickenella mellea]
MSSEANDLPPNGNCPHSAPLSSSALLRGVGDRCLWPCSADPRHLREFDAAFRLVLSAQRRATISVVIFVAAWSCSATITCGSCFGKAEHRHGKSDTPHRYMIFANGMIR